MVILANLVVVVFLAACGEKPVEWDRDPEAVVIQYWSPYTTAGAAGAYDSRYYIPEVRIWGDGRILWVERDGSSRRVLEGFLDPAKLESLLQEIRAAGFFAWDSSYQTLGGNSSPPMHLRVTLLEQSHEVGEHGGAPVEFYRWVDRLLHGTGTSGREWAPEKAWLTVAGWNSSGNAPVWPGDASGFSLDGVGEGCVVQGGLLAFSWALLNANPTAPAYVASGAKLHSLMLQIPGISFSEPPAVQHDCAVGR